MLRHGSVVKRYLFIISDDNFIKFHTKISPLLASMPNLIQLSLTCRVAAWPDFDAAQQLQLLVHLPSLRYVIQLLLPSPLKVMPTCSQIVDILLSRPI